VLRRSEHWQRRAVLGPARPFRRGPFVRAHGSFVAVPRAVVVVVVVVVIAVVVVMTTVPLVPALALAFSLGLVLGLVGLGVLLFGIGRTTATTITSITTIIPIIGRRHSRRLGRRDVGPHQPPESGRQKFLR